MKKLSRIFILSLAALFAQAFALHANAGGDSKVVSIGFQKGSGLLAVLKAQGTLEKSLEAQKLQVNWIEFPAGPQLWKRSIQVMLTLDIQGLHHQFLRRQQALIWSMLAQSRHRPVLKRLWCKKIHRSKA